MRPGQRDVHRLLPHGHPMVLLDRVELLVPGRVVEASKAVTVGEPCFAGLDGNTPPEGWALPSSLLVESFGQAAVVLWQATQDTELSATGAIPMLAVIRRCRFLGRAYPGDVLCHHVELDHSGPNTAIVSGHTAVGQCTIAEFGELMAVTGNAGKAGRGNGRPAPSRANGNPTAEGALR
ncbi:3-hydroxyacyl-ACP dehydratase FabZ family protein [Qaidamihabitans albus]|uniref:3-hydroxyacyl-ACP dehydratase FabZ family protein n=1 Tax=Qaidamihabitans albus TaxID=2795733 RepID=UPI0018F213EF|nr:beta-hydroxyacyl-ACP dehydratase [Qaidamihabitans albus]